MKYKRTAAVLGKRTAPRKTVFHEWHGINRDRVFVTFGVSVGALE